MTQNRTKQLSFCMDAGEFVLKGTKLRNSSFIHSKQLGMSLKVSGFRSLKRLVKDGINIRGTDERVD